MSNSTLASGETKVLVLRPHWIVLARAIAITSILGCVPLGVVALFPGIAALGSTSILLQALVVLGGSVYAFSVALFFAYAFIDYWLDVWTVTTRRILHVEQKGLFNRVIAELELVRIQDCTSETKGVLGTLLRYGTISIQTAAELPRFVFRDIPNPETVRDTVVRLMQEARPHKPT